MNRAGRILLTVILAEIVLGGGGRLTAVGPLSLRMVLFSLAMGWSVYFFARGRRLKREFWGILLLFFAVSALAWTRGLLAGAPRSSWWEDVKPLLYFLILPFFDFIIDIREPVRISHTVRSCSVLLAILFLITLILIHLKIFSFPDFYRMTFPTQEFFFRGEVTFFYKGFLFLGIGFIFFFFSDHPRRRAFMMLLFAAVLLSVTRGLVFALALTFVVYFISKTNYRKTVLALFVAIAVLAAGNYLVTRGSRILDLLTSAPAENRLPDSTLLGDRNYSDNGRLTQIKEVLAATTGSSFLLGHGFGVGVPSRPVHMEIAYLEIFHKQGVIGLAFWTVLLWVIFRKFREAENTPLANSFFFCTLFIYIQSLTNQYINNPIGLSFLLLSMVCLDRLRKSDPA